MEGHVETERLLGVPSSPSHRDGVFVLYGGSDVGDALWPGALGGPRTRDQVAEILASDERHRHDHGFGPWIWSAGPAGNVVARGGLLSTIVEGRQEIELLYAVKAECWGLGYATELALAATEHACTVAQAESVVAFTLPDNQASRRVMQKAGFTYERDITHADLPHVLYRKQWGQAVA